MRPPARRPAAAGSRPRAGVTLVELVTALALSGVLLAGLVAVMDRSTAVLARILERGEGAEALRTIWVVLDQELGAGAPGADWELEGEQAIRLRAFRGVARVCSPDAVAGGREVAWRGWRAPDPARDSVLVFDADGTWRPAGLEGVGGGSGGCELAPGERDAVLRWSGAETGRPLAVRWFERGRYSLEDGAFRYRRGGEGRQPLTAERIGEGSGFAMEEGALRVRVVLEPGRTVEWRIPFAAAGEVW